MRTTRNEKSCGVIIFRNNQNNLEYLLLQAKKHKEWGFPKGHVEEDETEYETAIREVKEESGLDVSVIDEFRMEIRYTIGDDVCKQAVYFLGHSEDQQVIMQESEIIDYAWVGLERALKLLPYDNIKEVLKKANEHCLKR